MRWLLTTLMFGLLSFLAHAEDRVEGDTTIKSLSAGQVAFAKFLNPTGDKGETLVYCQGQVSVAKDALANVQMGGIMLLSGGKLILKNDRSATYTNGSQVETKYLQFECGGK